MRLTLRTLLAYMDEILEPADREELAKKVESSEFAHDLIHRTKDTMRRLRLSAPQVVGTGIGLDPNTVAEYLDNMLPPDSVADFERICLESDVHLAEVASAHHILTMVLGEPAEVDPALRQRMYALPAQAEERKHLRIEPAHTHPAEPHDYAAVTPPPHVFPPAGPAQLVYSTAPHATQHSTAAVPDYLRASAWTRHGTLLAACAAVLLLAIGWLLYTSLGDWDGGGQQVALAPRTDTANDVQQPSEPPIETQPITSTAPTSPATSLAAAPPRLQLPPMGSAATDSTSSTPPVELAAPIDVAPPVITVDETAYGYGGNQDATTDSAPVDSAPAVDKPIVATTQDSTTPDATTANVAPAVNDLASSTPMPPAMTNPTSSVLPVADAAAVPDSTGAPAVDEVASAGTDALPPQPAEPVEIGTYLDGKNVLLRFDSQGGAWYRMAPRSSLYAGERLLALPAFFPKIMLTTGLHLKLVGGTMVSLGPEAAGSKEPAVDVNYGKAVIVNTTNDEISLKLTIGSETFDVSLGRNATLGVDVVPKYQPGQDPRKSPSPIMAHVFVRDGTVGWNDGSGAKEITAPAEWKIDGGVASPLAADVTFPDWIDQEPVEQRSEKLFGAPAVEAALDPTRPVEDQLLELYQSSRRREVKSLVARSSVYAGLFVPFVEALRDSDQKSAWKTHIDTLREAMSLGPDSAQKIYQTLVDQRGRQAADDLYQMLCGYGPEQIGKPDEFRNSLGTKLVDWMENDSLDYRVLAVQDMGEITGMRLMPNPAGSPTERARGIRLWRQRLKDGEVTPVAPAAE